ncbi:MAG: BatA domain-containing protein, partial [Planctomycetaceae bacterium]|nr:BatA domain-containing protein [Planctomycetaceae bacterium]
MPDPLPILAFGFISPWLLAGGVALSAVPLVIHLLRRRQYVDRPWAAMQFLQAALKSQARRVRLESVVLLAVRTLLILVAAAAVSQPFLDDDSLISGAASGRLRVLVVDTSLSMSAAGDAGTSLDRARLLASRIVETAPAGDAFTLVQIRRSTPFAVISRISRDRP